jgi:hypothetical protein
MADAVLVVLLLAFIFAAVLIPPAAGARASREAEFLGSIRQDGDPTDSFSRTGSIDQPRFRPALTPNARRRQVLGGLMVALAATLLLGLLPTFRLLLVVHLLLLNSCLAYVGLLVHLRDEHAALSRVATPPWRRTDDGVPANAFAEAVHPYAYATSEGFEYDADPAYATDDEWYGDEVAEGYADPASYTSYAYEGGYDDDEAEAEAAYVDDELALGLALPA